MNNAVVKTIDVTDEYQALADRSMVLTFTLTAPISNEAAVMVKVDDGEVDFSPGQWHTLHHVDLATISVKGTVGDTVSIVGGTW